MPPKTKFTKEEVVAIAFETVRKHGWDGLSARYIADMLNSSTMPVYSHFRSMRDLEDEVVRKAYELILEYADGVDTGDAWLDMSVGYVRFARDEGPLFRALTDERHVELRRRYRMIALAKSGEKLKDYVPFQGLSEDQIEDVRFKQIIFTYGLASIVNLSGARDDVSDERITELLQDMGRMLIRAAKEGM
jgi:AcrR family transcriptional regulator